MNNSTALEVTNLNYTYKKDWNLSGIQTLKDLTFTVEPGETFGFLGHNGAGKTTTIKCILNLIKPKSGGIKIFGVDHQNSNSRINLGYLAEQPYFYDHLTVGETLKMFAMLYGIKNSEIYEHIRQALDSVKFDGDLDAPMRTLSKGMTQRVGMAQAILSNPQLLILDEPFSGLDPIGRKEFRELILEQKQRGTTILISTHILSDVEAICDKAAIVARGVLKGVYNVKELGKEESLKLEDLFVNLTTEERSKPR